MSMSEEMLEIPDPKCTRNFIQENVIEFQEMQSSMRENEETNSVIEYSGRTTFENVPAEIISHINCSQLMNDKQIPSDDTAVSLHRQHTELSFKQKTDVSTSTEPSADFSAFMPVDSEEPIGFTGSRSVWCQTVGPENLDELYNVGVIKYSSTRNPLLIKSRHSENELPAGEVDQQMPRRSDDPDIQKLSLCEHKQDTHKSRHARNETDYIKENIMSVKARQRSIETRSNPLLAPSTYKRGVIPQYLIERRQRENSKNETEYRKTNAVSVKPRQGSIETVRDPLKPPSTCKRGIIPNNLKKDHETGSARNESNTKKTNVMSMKERHISAITAIDPLVPPPGYKKGEIPKYLKERREALEKEAKCKPMFPVLACPPGNVTQNDSYRNETLKMLKKRYSDLSQELRMMPVKTDIRMMYTKKIELTKKLKEARNAIRTFLELEACQTRPLND
ncbi:uncharacterized protein LOC117283118 [Cryptotermes secundus]|uniref:uncharacterized protein LOC117283118 n=1 Tax=Cryptotermes secundus TaxID=105785 RepID=UPI001454CB68|nr:uncharacterized protein LOC117283118 [Cryptotermes secundus]